MVHAVFFILRMIDQIRGSADGVARAVAANCVCFAIAGMLIPSLRVEAFTKRIYIWWTVIVIVLGTAAIFGGFAHWIYRGQWISGIFNVAVWGYYIL